MKNTQAANLLVGMVIIDDEKEFTVKHVQYTRCGNFVSYKVDQIAPYFQKIDTIFIKNVKETINTK